ncbi:MAG TPA: hypothetical protein VFL69_16770 [Marmoricola sp.]|nr:hypothetical protein [Marmoricola sp.]
MAGGGNLVDPGDDFDPGAGPGPELIRPEDFLPPNPFPVDAQRMGIDRFTGDNGALIAVAASLDPGKLSHRIVAWLLLLVVTTPVALEVWQILR